MEVKNLPCPRLDITSRSYIHPSSMFGFGVHWSGTIRGGSQHCSFLLGCLIFRMLLSPSLWYTVVPTARNTSESKTKCWARSLCGEPMSIRKPIFPSPERRKYDTQLCYLLFLLILMKYQVLPIPCFTRLFAAITHLLMTILKNELFRTPTYDIPGLVVDVIVLYSTAIGVSSHRESWRAAGAL